MKKFFTGLALVALLIPTVVFAANFRANSNVSQNEIIEGNLYMAGRYLTVSGNINGDLYMAGGNITITGNVAEDATLAGGNINIMGKIDGDLRLAGGETMINNVIGGELIAFGGYIELGKNTVVNGDLIVNAGELVIDPQAKVLGKIIQSGQKKPGQEHLPVEDNFLKRISIAAVIFGFVTSFLVILVFHGIFPNLTQKIVNTGLDKKLFWRNFRTGLLMLIVMPIAAMIALVTVVGACPWGYFVYSLYWNDFNKFCLCRRDVWGISKNGN